MTTRRAPRKHILSPTKEDAVFASVRTDTDGLAAEAIAKKPRVAASRRRAAAAKPALPSQSQSLPLPLSLPASSSSLFSHSQVPPAVAAVPAERESREHIAVSGYPCTGPLDPAVAVPVPVPVPRPPTSALAPAATAKTFFPTGWTHTEHTHTQTNTHTHTNTRTHTHTETRSRTSSGDSSALSLGDEEVYPHSLSFPFSSSAHAHAHAHNNASHAHYETAAPLTAATHAAVAITAAASANTSTAQEEKALAAKQIAKEKNREHAKNTRRRKKQFIEALQQSISELKAEKEKAEKDKKIMAIKQAEQMELHKRVVQDVLSFRVQGVMDRALWTTLLDETVELTLPITPYRSFPPFQVSDGQRHVKGIDAVMLDSASLHAFFQSIVPQFDNESENPQKKLQVYCQCASNEAVSNEHTLCCAFSLRTYNAVRLGARRELFIGGLLRATFSVHNKLTALVLSFDVLALLQLLRNPVAPNTRELALDGSLCVQREGRLLIDCMSSEPTIVDANEIWLQSFPLYPDGVVGRSLFDVVLPRIVEREKAAEFSEYLSHGLPFCTVATLCLCEHNQTYVSVWLKLFPLYVTTEDAQCSLSQSLLVMERLSCERENAHTHAASAEVASADISVDTEVMSASQSLSTHTLTHSSPPAVPVCDGRDGETIFSSLSGQLGKAYQRSYSAARESCEEDAPLSVPAPAPPSAVIGAKAHIPPTQPQSSLLLSAPRTSSISQAFRNAQAQRTQQRDPAPSHRQNTHPQQSETTTGGLRESTSTRSFDSQFADFLRDCVDSSHSEYSLRDVENEETKEREELCEALLNMESDKICDFNSKL